MWGMKGNRKGEKEQRIGREEERGSKDEGKEESRAEPQGQAVGYRGVRALSPPRNLSNATPKSHAS